MAAAKLHVRTPSGARRIFLADTCDVAGGAVHATGHWKGGTERAEYVWPVRRVLQIRWESSR